MTSDNGKSSPFTGQGSKWACEMSKLQDPAIYCWVWSLDICLGPPASLPALSIFSLTSSQINAHDASITKKRMKIGMLYFRPPKGGTTYHCRPSIVHNPKQVSLTCETPDIVSHLKGTKYLSRSMMVRSSAFMRPREELYYWGNGGYYRGLKQTWCDHHKETWKQFAWKATRAILLNTTGHVRVERWLIIVAKFNHGHTRSRRRLLFNAGKDAGVPRINQKQKKILFKMSKLQAWRFIARYPGWKPGPTDLAV